ncbi:MAG TPA: LPS assembly lipoprotein LptE [Thiobacillaceae bacterium]|nr:LPS assembly lipoprotein LptE [Thiobacillaceae bacterium]HNU64318.1 LPS assembly lipoprotein LptE [Thiobacillaceae bacterium]
MKRAGLGWLAMCVLLLAGCGFQLRGEAQLPFAGAYVESSDGSLLAPALRQALADQGKLAEHAGGVPVLVRVLDERMEKNILSLSGGGKVREYRLIYKTTLKVTDEKGDELIAPIELEQIREYSYDDAQILAKEVEESALQRAMVQETLRQALRRLSYVKR